MASKKALVPIGNGSEEWEAVTIIDVLRRAGTDVCVASVEDSLEVTCSRRVKIVADANIADVTTKDFDLIALPGGMPGAERLRDSKELIQLLRQQKGEGKLYAAICASPAVVFEHHGLIEGRPATAFPAFCDKLTNKESVEDRVVKADNLITSRGPGTAMEFALQLVAALHGLEKAREVAKATVPFEGWDKYIK
ncbi:hypothetical protein QBZ16_003783 [Prototheca wickerhamii]|uniref:DJ-1/PfpI domain-containing protein n=1 Tax=Prototheca wickerhamii TaxID=3111 RepID=A0AAD9IJR8_PROWI|nr:hypothetical protein QBZ16_003783 [Prototheca wickerhamii]